MYKKIILSFFFVLLSGFIASPVLAIESDELDFGIWHFDEMSGATAYDSGPNQNSLIWGPNYYGGGRPYPNKVPGKWDMGINFSQYEEHYYLERSEPIDFSSGLSLGLWLKTDYSSSDKIKILWLGNYLDSRIQDPSNFILLSLESGRVVLDLKQDKEWQGEISSSILANDNNWHFVSAVFDTAEKRFYLYLDGQEQGSAAFDLPLPTLQRMSVGRREYYFDPLQYNFSGVIDDLWIRRSAMRPERIEQIYNSNEPYKQMVVNQDLAPITVFANHDFDHINGTVALDNSPNHYDLIWGYNPYSAGEPNPRIVPGKFDNGVNFKKVWDAYAMRLDTAQNFGDGMSLGIWIKTEAISTDPSRILWFGNEMNSVIKNQAIGDYFRLTEQAGKLTATLNYFDLYHQDSQKLFSRQYNASSDKFISDNEWHQVVVSLDPRPGVHAMKLYIDGELQNEAFFPNAIPSLTRLYLAHRELASTGTEYNYAGDLDDLFVLNSVLKPEEVQDIYQSNQAFTWPIQKKRNPVIIVPGIMGSYLKRASDGEEVWPNLFKMVLPGKDSYLDELNLPYSGESFYSDIYPDNILRKISGNDFFQGLIIELTNKGYREGVDLFVFPYDWRLDVSEIAGDDSSLLTNTLSGFIKKVKAFSGSEKIDIIAHSMGGLVVKKYIYNSSNNPINKFVDVATPHFGAPEAFKILQYGDDLNIRVAKISILDEERVKIISQNFPSVYQLLPSRNYFEVGNYFYDHYIYFVQAHKPAYDYEQSMDYLKLSGRNWGLADKAQNIHDEIDNMNIPNVYNIVGCGMPTLGLFRIKDVTDDYEKDIDPKYLFGDGTVPLRSALGINTRNVYFENQTEHAYLPSINGVRQLVSSILGNDVDNFNFNQYKNLSQNSNDCGYSGVQLGIHSPVDLNIYDENNNHVGPNENGDIEINIPGAQYDIFGDKKFAFLPAGHQYHVTGKVTGLGSFSLRIERIENGDYKDQVYFNDVPIDNINMVINYDIEDTQNIGGIKIKKDNDGDGDYEEQVEPSSILNEVEAEDTETPTTEISINGDLSSTGTEYFSPVTLEFNAVDTLSGILKTEYSINSTSTWEIYASSSKPIIQEPGDYTIYYFSVDRAGIRERIKSKTITVIEKDCLESLTETVNSLYNQGKIKKLSARNQLLLKFELIEKMLDKYSARDKRLCGNFEICKLIGNKLNKITKLLIEIDIRFIQEQLKLYEKQKWITKEARDIILSKMTCLNNYLK